MTAEAGNRELTDDERAKRDASLAEIKTIDADVKAIEETEELRSLVKPTPARRAVGASHGPSEREYRELITSEEYRSAFEIFMNNQDDRELRALGAITGSSGGYLVPTIIYNDIFDATKALSPFMSRVNRIASDDAKLSLPLMTASGGFAYTGEAAAPSASDPTLGQLTLNRLISQWNVVADENLRNSAVDINSWMSQLFAQGLAKFLEKEIIVGAGTTALSGVMVGGTVAVTTASATAITRAELETCYWAMPEAYLESAVWVMSSSSASKIAAISNSVTGDNLWAPSLADGYSWQLNGRPALISSGAPAWAANKNLIAFVEPSSYVLKDGGLEVAMSEHAAFTSRGIVYRAVWNGDGGLAAATHAQIIKSHA